MDVTKEQASPTPNAHPAVWDLVLADMQDRDQVGLARYGTRLQAHNGRRALTDAYQEVLDLAVYLRQEIQERTHPQIDTLFLDLDGVLVDFVGGTLKRHKAPQSRLTPGEWDINKSLGLTPEAFWAPLHGHDFWAGLEPLPDYREVLSIVTGVFPPEKVWLLSSPSDDPGSCSGKYSWVSRHLPSYSRRLILTPDKRPLARPGGFLIDDHSPNVEGWMSGGGEGWLFPRPWNHRHKNQGEALLLLQGLMQILRGRVA